MIPIFAQKHKIYHRIFGLGSLTGSMQGFQLASETLSWLGSVLLNETKHLIIYVSNK